MPLVQGVSFQRNVSNLPNYFLEGGREGRGDVLLYRNKGSSSKFFDSLRGACQPVVFLFGIAINGVEVVIVLVYRNVVQNFRNVV